MTHQPNRSATTQRQRPDSFSVRCHARSTLVLEPIDAKLRTLRQCDREGRIDSLDIQCWPDEVRLSGDGGAQDVITAYDEYLQWAGACDVELHPPFRVRRSNPMACEASEELLVTPVFLVAVYTKGDLVGVFPHRDGEVHRSAADAIAALRTGRYADLFASMPTPDWSDRQDRPASVSPPSDRETPRQCPDCEGALLNVQGILACCDCFWSAAVATTQEARRDEVPLPTGRESDSRNRA